MTFYSEMAVVAHELLLEFGKPVVLRRVMPGTYDPATGTAAVTTADLPATGALFDYDLRSSGQGFQPETLIQAGDKQCLLSPQGVTEPQSGDFIVDGAVLWTVINVKSVNPAGTPVLYDLLLRV